MWIELGQSLQEAILTCRLPFCKRFTLKNSFLHSISLAFILFHFFSFPFLNPELCQLIVTCASLVHIQPPGTVSSSFIYIFINLSSGAQFSGMTCLPPLTYHLTMYWGKFSQCPLLSWDTDLRLFQDLHNPWAVNISEAHWENFLENECKLVLHFAPRWHCH